MSCQSCRIKKLKCSRVQPCANCTTRGLDCVFLVPPAQMGSGSGRFKELLERIEKLEALVPSRVDHGSTPASPGFGSETTGADTVLNNQHWETFESLGTSDFSSVSSVGQLDNDIRMLIS